MKTLFGAIVALLFATFAAAQARTDASLRITVVDPSGAVIVGARASLISAGGAATPSVASLDTGVRGDVTFTAIEPGRYTIHVESPGFESADVRDYRVRAGENRREIKLAIAK